MNEYIVIQWPESQYLAELEGFIDNCYLINDKKGINTFGSLAYFVNKEWYDKQN